MNVTPVRRRLRRLGLATIILALPLGLGACGNKEQHPTHVDNEAAYVDAGPMTYQVQLSRELNPYAVEDRTYLSGLSPSLSALSPSQVWFAIFLWAKNQSGQAHLTAGQFDIVDTQGNKYTPVAVDARQNPIAWQQLTIQPNMTEPNGDAIAASAPTQGGELLFKLNSSVYDNRPLTLEIYAPGKTSDPSTVSLDL